ncbi:MAG: hypothetical protein ABDH16_00005, partial [Thermodesulfovibrionaceae bacterium]
MKLFRKKEHKKLNLESLNINGKILVGIKVVLLFIFIHIFYGISWSSPPVTADERMKKPFPRESTEKLKIAPTVEKTSDLS